MRMGLDVLDGCVLLPPVRRLRSIMMVMITGLLARRVLIVVVMAGRLRISDIDALLTDAMHTDIHMGAGDAALDAGLSGDADARKPETVHDLQELVSMLR